MTLSHWIAGSRIGRAAMTALALVTALVGCTVNPTTGRQQFSLMSPQQEADTGQREFPRLAEQFGGAYQDPALAAYVERIGRQVLRTTRSAGQPYRFTVLNSDLPNAFALPGGYVTVTRGLLALMNDEAELAGVMAHEIAHVTARHSAERYSQATLAQLGAGLLGSVTGNTELAEIAGSGAQLYLLSYGRGQESEADAIGIRYLTAAGYDPYAMSSFLRQLGRETELSARIDGRSSGGGLPAYLSSHPRTADRVQQASALAAQAPGQHSRRDRDAYLAAIDGLLWGESGAGGFIDGAVLSHPDEGFRWEAPQGFRLGHSGQRVIGTDNAGSQITFDVVSPSGGNNSPRRYLTAEWARGGAFSDLQPLNVNGYQAATGMLRLNTSAGIRDARLIAIRSDQGRMSRLVFLTPPDRTARMEQDIRRSTYSFRPLSRAQRSAIRPRRIDIITVRRGDTVSALARRMAFDDLQVQRFLTLNGLEPGTPLQAGQKVKLIVN